MDGVAPFWLKTTSSPRSQSRLQGITCKSTRRQSRAVIVENSPTRHLAGDSCGSMHRAFLGGSNPDFTLPLHAVSGFGSCDDQPVDCLGNRPNTSVAPGNGVDIPVGGHDSAVAGYWLGSSGIPPGAISPSCSIVGPARPAFLPKTNSMGVVSAFFCVNGPALTVVGRIVFSVGRTGCLGFIDPRGPDGIIVMDCQQEIDEITDLESADWPGMRGAGRARRLRRTRARDRVNVGPNQQSY